MGKAPAMQTHSTSINNSTGANTGNGATGEVTRVVTNTDLIQPTQQTQLRKVHKYSFEEYLVFSPTQQADDHDHNDNDSEGAISDPLTEAEAVAEARYLHAMEREILRLEEQHWAKTDMIIPSLPITVERSSNCS
jgi:hypothetical protein